MITTHHEFTPEFLASQNLSPTFQERFWKFVQKTDGCWIWTGCKTGSGYGSIRSTTGTMIAAHRASWLLHHGPIPDGLCCLHACDNPLCVSVEHLFLGTKKDNKVDCIAKGRHAHGETHGRVKLTEAEAMKILNLIKTGNHKGKRWLGRQFGVTHSTICHIGSGLIWAHLQGHD